MSDNSPVPTMNFQGGEEEIPVLIVGYAFSFNNKDGEPFQGASDGWKTLIAKGPDGKHFSISKNRPNYEAGTSKPRTNQPCEHTINVQQIGRDVELCEVPWGKRVYTIACEVILQFVEDLDVHAFLVRPSPDGPSTGLISVRLSKFSGGSGLPDEKVVEKYAHRYRKKLVEAGERGEIPDSIALEVLVMGDTFV